MAEHVPADHDTTDASTPAHGSPDLTPEAVAQRIGEEYVETDRFPREDDAVTQMAYEMLGEHHERLYEELPGPVRWTDDDPYKDAADMFRRIDENEALWVFTAGSHPEFLTWAQNVKGRAVHDYVGHYRHKVDFSVRGEYAKWQAARDWYPVGTHWFLFTEIVAQRCAAA